MTYQPSYEVRNAEIEALLQGIGFSVKDALRPFPGYGFTLMIFSYGNLFYLSSANREDMIRAMDEFKQKFREN